MAASGFGHLGLDERQSLFRMHEARLGVTETVARLGRHRLTIYRELGRNRHRDPNASRDSLHNMFGLHPGSRHGSCPSRQVVTDQPAGAFIQRSQNDSAQYTFNLPRNQ